MKEQEISTDSPASDVACSQPESPLSSVVNGELHINKASVADLARRMAKRVGIDEEDWISRLIMTIKRFLMRLYFALLPTRYGQSQFTDGANRYTLCEEADASPLLSEDEKSYVVKGLPNSALERIHHTVSEIVSGAVGERLPHSLKAALSMPELGQRQIFRVFLQQNLDDTNQIREVSAELRKIIEEKIIPFAREYHLDSKEAVDILCVDIGSEEGIIAGRLDSKEEVRSHIDELKHLDSALVGLAKARGMICASAMKSGAYTRDELAELVEQMGLASTFLYQSEYMTMPPELKAKAEDDNVISIEKYQTKMSQSAKDTNQCIKEGKVEFSDSVRSALTKLAEQGVIEKEAAEKLEQEAILNAVLSEEAEFDVDIQTDELDDFFQRHPISKLTPQ